MAAISTAQHFKFLKELGKLAEAIDPAEHPRMEKDAARLQAYFALYNAELEVLRKCLAEYSALQKAMKQRLRKSVKANRSPLRLNS